MSRLKERYESQIKNLLRDKFSYSNVMKIPQLKKIVISMGLAEALKDKNIIQDCGKELSLISGQKPILMKSKKAISNFKLRKGVDIGLKVTLRKKRMYDFLDRFINIVCPRIRDFRGFGLKCDGRGNYSLGLSDHQVFPELKLDEVKREQGMNISFVTTATKDEECLELLRFMGFPFKK